MAPEDSETALVAPTRTLVAQCLCGGVHFTLTVPTAKLPLGVHMCHCSVCRLTHGTYSCFHAPLPAGIVPHFVAPSSLAGSCTGYRHARAAATRYFCKTCGCHIGDEDWEEAPDGSNVYAAEGKIPEWRIASSLFGPGLHDDGGPDQAFSLRSHFLTKAAPSGYHQWILRLGSATAENGGRALAVWNPPAGDPNFPMANEPYAPAEAEHDADGNEVVRVACHCEGVSFTIARPEAPLPAGAGDDGKPSPTVVSPSFLARFTPPDDTTRWAACLDACDDCRRVTGAHVVGWAFVPLSRTRPRVPAALAPFGTLVRYISPTTGTRRGFCGVCGATVFVTGPGRSEQPEMDDRDEVVDVAAALLRAPEGVSAHSWLRWRAGRLAWPQSGQRYHADFASGLGEGFAAWGAATYGEAGTFDIGG